MKDKLKQVKKYLSDKYYIEDWEWNIGIFPSFESYSHYRDNIHVYIMWSEDSSNIYLEDVKNKFDILKIESILKGSGVKLVVDYEEFTHE